MSIQVDASDPTPPFEQIRASLAVEISSGRLPAGHRLPTVRQLAADLRVAPGTAARAYRELEQAGFVETRRALGTVVRAGNVAVPDAAVAAAAFVAEVAGHVTLEDALAAVRAQWPPGRGAAARTSIDRSTGPPEPPIGSSPASRSTRSERA